MSKKAIETLKEILQFPEYWAVPGTTASCPEAASNAGLARASLARAGFPMNAAAGDQLAGAVLALLPADAAGMENLSCSTPQAIYELAAEKFASGSIHRAAALLASLLNETAGQCDAFIALAICAIRLELFDPAFQLASESIRRGTKHPRAFCIAGLCALDRGDRTAAQSCLALATRLARARPECQEDLRVAQRALLILHFG